jgi:hypothetical protein
MLFNFHVQLITLTCCGKNWKTAFTFGIYTNCTVPARTQIVPYLHVHKLYHTCMYTNCTVPARTQIIPYLHVHKLYRTCTYTNCTIPARTQIVPYLHVHKLYRTCCTYNNLSEDEPSGSKPAKYIVKIKILF